MSEVQQKVRIEIPNDLDSTDRLKLGRAVVNHILERTANNTDVNGKRFANYSKAYANSLEFKIAGKSKNDPNLRLQGDMLDSLGILEHGPGYVTVGYSAGSQENNKAAWAAASDNGPSRRFLGIQEADLEILIADIRTEIPTNVRELTREEIVQKRIATATAQQATQSILNSLGFNFDEAN
jgi:hypothetical protein